MYKYTYKMSNNCYYCKNSDAYKCAFCRKFLCYPETSYCSRINQTNGHSVLQCMCGIGSNELICKDCIRINGKPGIILHTVNGDHYVLYNTETNSFGNDDHNTSRDLFYFVFMLIMFSIGLLVKK
jgi:hypothetical protein